MPKLLSERELEELIEAFKRGDFRVVPTLLALYFAGEDDPRILAILNEYSAATPQPIGKIISSPQVEIFPFPEPVKVEPVTTEPRGVESPRQLGEALAARWRGKFPQFFMPPLTLFPRERDKERDERRLHDSIVNEFILGSRASWKPPDYEKWRKLLGMPEVGLPGGASPRDIYDSLVSGIRQYRDREGIELSPEKQGFTQALQDRIVNLGYEKFGRLLQFTVEEERADLLTPGDKKGKVISRKVEGLDAAFAEQVFSVLEYIGRDDSASAIALIEANPLLQFFVEALLDTQPPKQRKGFEDAWAGAEANKRLADTTDAFVLQEARDREKTFRLLFGEPTYDQFVYLQKNTAASLGVDEHVKQVYRFLGASVEGEPDNPFPGSILPTTALYQELKELVDNKETPFELKDKAVTQSGAYNYDLIRDYQIDMAEALRKARASEAAYAQDIFNRSPLTAALPLPELIPIRKPLSLREWLMNRDPSVLEEILKQRAMPTEEEIATLPPELAILARVGLLTKDAAGNIVQTQATGLLDRAPGEGEAEWQARLRAILGQSRATGGPSVDEAIPLLLRGGLLPPTETELEETFGSVAERVFRELSLRMPLAQRESFLVSARLQAPDLRKIFFQLVGEIPKPSSLGERPRVIQEFASRFGSWLQSFNLASPTMQGLFPSLSVEAGGEAVSATGFRPPAFRPTLTMLPAPFGRR